MVEHVLGNLVEVGRDGRALEARLERGDSGGDETRGEGAFDLADLPDQLAHQFLLMHRHGREQVGKLALLLAQPFTLRLGKLLHLAIEILGRLGRLAADERDEHDLAGGRALDCETALARGGLELGEQLLGAAVILLAQRLALLVEVFAAKGLGQLLDEEADEVAHPVAQLGALPATQVNRGRRLGTLEVVDVDPVARRRYRRRPLLEDADYRFALAPRAHAADEDVVAGRADTDRHAHRVERTLLAEQLVSAVARRLHQFVGTERRMAAQLIRTKFSRRGRGLRRLLLWRRRGLDVVPLGHRRFLFVRLIAL